MSAPISRGEIYLGKYQAVRLLAEGGMGRVFLGRNLSTGEDVVIKVMREQQAQQPLSRSAFQREIEVMKQFRHPHAVAFLDGSVTPPFLVMEYVAGVTLEQRLAAQGPLPPDVVGRLLGQLCQVLQAAHDAGIVHRDLKTENLMFVDSAGGGAEQLKVMDFGLARPGGGGFFLPAEQLTGTGHSIGGGTPDYMSPEQVRGEKVDHRGDLYSVGVVLFKLATGRLPFGEVKETADILLAHVRRQPPRFHEMGVTSVPPPVEAVIRSCLAKEPRDRPQSARELAILFGKALGRPIVDEASFIPAEVATKPSGPVDSSRSPVVGLVLGRFEAWMPEPVALMKLRGFIDGVGGQVADSVPGLIRVRLQDPRARPKPEARSIWGLLGFGRPTVPAPGLLIDLWMQKKEAGARSLVEITVALPEEALNADSGTGGHVRPPESPEDEAMRRGFGERICRELRAYLMIGR